MADLYDVIAVEIDSGQQRLVSSKLSERNADAVICMAVMRRGVEVEFYKSVPHPWSPPNTRGTQE